MANLVLRVTPETLEKKADEFSAAVKQIEASFNRIQQVSGKTKGYWQGDAGTADRNGYASYKEDIRFMIKRLSEHPTDLLHMAGIYREAERDVSNLNAQLKTDQIV